MNDLKPRPLWPLLTAALIGLPVLYVASFGPACWAVDSGLIDYTRVRPIYKPLLAAAVNCRGVLSRVAGRVFCACDARLVRISVRTVDDSDGREIVSCQALLSRHVWGDSNRPAAR